jgi:hypothetical protein
VRAAIGLFIAGMIPMLLGACAALPAPSPVEYLDERTGVTLVVADAPLVLARERRDLAANARDYLTLVGVIRDESGRLLPILLIHRWSTIDARVTPDAAATPASLVIVADGRDIRLEPLEPPPRELAARDPRLWWPEDARAVTLAYRADAAVLRYIAESARVSAFFDAPGGDLPYSVWRDGRAALARLADAVGPP